MTKNISDTVVNTLNETYIYGIWPMRNKLPRRPSKLLINNYIKIFKSNKPQCNRLLSVPSRTQTGIQVVEEWHLPVGRSRGSWNKRSGIWKDVARLQRMQPCRAGTSAKDSRMSRSARFCRFDQADRNILPSAIRPQNRLARLHLPSVFASSVDKRLPILRILVFLCLRPCVIKSIMKIKSRGTF